MHLTAKRSQEKSLFGANLYVLEMKLEVSPADTDAWKRHNVDRHYAFPTEYREDGSIIATYLVRDIRDGVVFKSKSMTEVELVLQRVKERLQMLRRNMRRAEGYDGEEEIIDFD